MLASNAHVSIGGYEFILDETVDAGTAVGNLYRPHYKWSQVNFFGPGQTVDGGNMNLRASRMWWMDDFIGGEGNRTFQPGDPTVYDFSYGLNPRIRGQLTVKPTRTRTTLTTSAGAKPAFFGVAHGVLWATGGRSLSYFDGSSWTDVSTTGVNFQGTVSANWYATAVGSNPDRLIVGMSNGSQSQFALYCINKANIKTLSAASWTSTMFLGFATLHGMIWSLEWDLANAVKLYRYDTTTSSGYAYDSTNSTQRKQYGAPIAFESGGDFTAANFGTSWWAGCAASQTSVFYFVSTPGQSRIMKYDHVEGPAPVWYAPDGFTIRDIEFHNGYLYIVGHWGPTATAGFGAVYIYDPKSQDVIPVAEPGRTRGLNATLSLNAASFENTSLVCDAANGRFWIYDADEDAVTLLDTIATTGGDTGLVTQTDAVTFTVGTHVVGDIRTFQGGRFAIIYGSGSYQVLQWSNDEPSNRQAGTATGTSVASLTSGIWDFGLPFQQKQLIGFDLVWDATTTTVSGQTITVEYNADGSGWTSAGGVTGGSGDYAKGRTFIALGSAQNFTTIKFRLTISGTNGNLPPIVYGVAAEAQALQQVWELIVRVKNPQAATRGGKQKTMVNAEDARNALRTMIANGLPVTFLDGYRYKNKGEYSTHTVTVEDPEDTVIRGSEGSMRLTLREV